ncbi:MAG: hypothetical protein ACI9YB_003061 [Halioglobus sp.]|jgi:hypothetical protein
MVIRKIKLNEMLQDLIEMADITELQSEEILQDMADKSEEWKNSSEGKAAQVRMESMEFNGRALSSVAKTFRLAINNVKQNDGSLFKPVDYLV